MNFLEDSVIDVVNARYDTILSETNMQQLMSLQVKCDRASPCHHCVKAGAQCSYATGLKPRERRQRVMVSNT
jgi:hypothetical protein